MCFRRRCIVEAWLVSVKAKDRTISQIQQDRIKLWALILLYRFSQSLISIILNISKRFLEVIIQMRTLRVSGTGTTHRCSHMATDQRSVLLRTSKRLGVLAVDSRTIPSLRSTPSLIPKLMMVWPSRRLRATVFPGKSRETEILSLKTASLQILKPRTPPSKAPT